MGLTRELKRLPLSGELRRKARDDKGFPNHSAFARFGGKQNLLDAVSRYCEAHAGHEDIVALLGHRTQSKQTTRPVSRRIGIVVLQKSEVKVSGSIYRPMT